MRMSLLFGNSASDGLTAAASSTSGLALSSDLKRATSSKMAHRMLRPRTERKLFVVTWMMTLFDKRDGVAAAVDNHLGERRHRFEVALNVSKNQLGLISVARDATHKNVFAWSEHALGVEADRGMSCEQCRNLSLPPRLPTTQSSSLTCLVGGARPPATVLNIARSVALSGSA